MNFLQDQSHIETFLFAVVLGVVFRIRVDPYLFKSQPRSVKKRTYRTYSDPKPLFEEGVRPAAGPTPARGPPS